MRATIMIVDDSLMIRQQVRTALTCAEFDLVEAEDGIDALEKLKVSSVSLVVCDVNMPRMGGLEFLAELRTREKFKALAVLMLTTEALPDLVRRAKELHAKGWIVKPFKREMLMAAARKVTFGAAA